MTRKRNFQIQISLISIIFLISSCAHVSKQAPSHMEKMHDFLTQETAGTCGSYHYNFERQAPRLYNEGKPDSILTTIEYIKEKCGPADNLEIAKTLILANEGMCADSLIGTSTVPLMLRYRSEQDYLLARGRWSTFYYFMNSTDNSRDNFNEFLKSAADSLLIKSSEYQTEHLFGLFYSGSYDSALGIIQSEELAGSKLQNEYDEFIRFTKRTFPSRGHICITLGGWNPSGNNKFLGTHPDIGIQLGAEYKWWRADFIIGNRFLKSKNNYLVDSLGNIVSTNEFNSWYIGVEGGIKLIDLPKFSTDIFVGLGYDAIMSVTETTDIEEPVVHDSFSASIGLRQRYFPGNGSFYIGGRARYNLVKYDNPYGTSLSGNTYDISLVCGWVMHETLYQFLDMLNFKGNKRR